MNIKGIAVATLAAIALAGCAGHGSSPAAQQTPSPNLRACQHYRVQRTHVLNLATPTLADAIMFKTWVMLDARQSEGQVHAAFQAMVTDMDSGRSDANSSQRVLDVCRSIGVTFQR